MSTNQQSAISMKERIAHFNTQSEYIRDGVIDFMSTWGILILPAIPATITFVAGLNGFALLGLPLSIVWFLSISVVLGVEIFGLSTSETYLKVLDYNSTLEDDESALPTEDILNARNWYIALVFALAIVLEILPIVTTGLGLPLIITKVTVSLVLLPILYIVMLGVRVSLVEKSYRRNMDAREQRNTEQDERQQLNATIEQLEQNVQSLSEQLNDRDEQIERLNNAQNVQTVEHTENVQSFEDVRATGNEQKRSKVGERREHLLNILLNEYNGTDADELNKSELAERLNTSHTTIGRDLSALESDGRINVNGVVTVA